MPNFGNSNYGKPEKFTTLLWDGATDNKVDIRLFYIFRPRDNWSRCRWDPTDESIPKFWRISDVTKVQICYTAESLKYA